MLTFEKVLDAFKDFLATDDMFEVVMTSHGYAILEWDSRMKNWIEAKCCATPQDMAEILLNNYIGTLEYQVTLARRELTEDDLAQIEAQRQIMLAKLQG
ncbi:MAG: hypothetical protein HDT26_13725 [Subdoligranulum sp.]|nr:hypothetical protein [Subdoligranulum sp.]